MQSEAQIKKTRANQDAFLAAFTVTGSTRASADAVKVDRHTVNKWKANNTHGFKEKFATAEDEFREMLQDLAVDRVRNQRPNDNPVLLITLLNAHWPEKYRRTGHLADDQAKEIMSEWKRWVKDSRRHAKTREEATDRDNAIEEAERILARKSGTDTDEPVG